LPIALDAHGDRRERSSAQLRCAQRFAVACPNTLQEVCPQGVRVEPRRLAIHQLARDRLFQPSRRARSATGIVRNELESLVHEFDRTQVATDDLFDRIAVDHGGGNDELAAFVIVGDYRGHIWHIAFIIFQVNSACSHYPRWVANPHGGNHMRCLMHEQISKHAATERPITAPLAVYSAVEGNLWPKWHAG